MPSDSATRQTPSSGSPRLFKALSYLSIRIVATLMANIMFVSSGSVEAAPGPASNLATVPVSSPTEMHLKRARALYENGSLNAARSIVSSVLKQQPNNTEAYMLSAWIHAAGKEWEPCWVDLHQIVDKSTDPLLVNLDRAIGVLLYRYNSQMRGLLKMHASELHSDFVAAVVQAKLSVEGEGSLAHYEALLRQAEAIAPSRRTYVDYQLAGIRAVTGEDLIRAVSLLQTILRSYPESYFAHWHLAMAECKLRQPSKAKPHIELLMRLRPRDFYTFFARATFHLVAGNSRLAADECEEAARLAESDVHAPAHNACIGCYSSLSQQLKDPQQVRYVLAKVIAHMSWLVHRNPDDQYCQLREQSSLCQENYEAFISDVNMHRSWQCHFGFALPESVIAYKDALSQNRARADYGWLLIMALIEEAEGNYQSCLRHLESAFHCAPVGAKCMIGFHLGRIDAYAGDPTRAVTLLKPVVTSALSHVSVSEGIKRIDEILKPNSVILNQSQTFGLSLALAACLRSLNASAVSPAVRSACLGHLEASTLHWAPVSARSMIRVHLGRVNACAGDPVRVVASLKPVVSSILSHVSVSEGIKRVDAILEPDLSGNIDQSQTFGLSIALAACLRDLSGSAVSPAVRSACLVHVEERVRQSLNGFLKDGRLSEAIQNNYMFQELEKYEKSELLTPGLTFQFILLYAVCDDISRALHMADLASVKFPDYPELTKLRAAFLLRLGDESEACQVIEHIRRRFSQSCSLDELRDMRRLWESKMALDMLLARVWRGAMDTRAYVWREQQYYLAQREKAVERALRDQYLFDAAELALTRGDNKGALRLLTMAERKSSRMFSLRAFALQALGKEGEAKLARMEARKLKKDEDLVGSSQARQ